MKMVWSDDEWGVWRDAGRGEGRVRGCCGAGTGEQQVWMVWGEGGNVVLEKGQV